MINIIPIEDMINEHYVEVDALNREYDHSEKTYQVLCRSGWSDVKYVYRHKTNKPIYRVSDGSGCVDVTEDHSLFDEHQNEIKPTQITPETKLEYNTRDIWSGFNTGYQGWDTKKHRQCAKFLISKMIDCVPFATLNGTIEDKKAFLDVVKDSITLENNYSKTAVAGVNYLKKCIEKNGTECSKI